MRILHDTDLSREKRDLKPNNRDIFEYLNNPAAGEEATDKAAIRPVCPSSLEARIDRHT
jgi:hypothetical protein